MREVGYIFRANVGIIGWETIFLPQSVHICILLTLVALLSETNIDPYDGDPYNIA